MRRGTHLGCKGEGGSPWNRGGAIDSHHCYWRGSWPLSRKAEQRGGPRVHQERDGLTCYLEQDPGLSLREGVSGCPRGPRQSLSNLSSWKAGLPGSGFPPRGGAEDPPRRWISSGPSFDIEDMAALAPWDWDVDGPSIPQCRI